MKQDGFYTVSEKPTLEGSSRKGRSTVRHICPPHSFPYTKSLKQKYSTDFIPLSLVRRFSTNLTIFDKINKTRDVQGLKYLIAIQAKLFGVEFSLEMEGQLKLYV